jgi:CheY-like chemotaxis protein
VNKTQPVTIILVEDDAGHALLIEKNLRRAGVENAIVHLKDGEQALEYLFKQAPDPGAGPAGPLLVLLDLNLPVLDGYQTLKHLKGDTRTRNIPVVILTTADNPDEVARCYELGCNVFVTKPVAYEEFSDAVRKLGMFLTIANIPGRK